MTPQKMILVTWLVACATSLTAIAVDATAATDATALAPKKYQYRAVVIQGAGYLPDAKKPEGVDAITHATTKGVNTYALTDALVAKLTALGITVEVLQFNACKDLACLDASADGTVKNADLVIFAGPEYMGKPPKQLSDLYPKLKDVAIRNPGLVCTTLVSAGSKGAKSIAVTEAAFKAAGVKFVPGVGLNSPRLLGKGASTEEIDTAMTDFAARLIAALPAVE